jgi:hypothetical protein
MKNIVYVFLVLMLVSCSNKEVLLPQVDRTIVATVEDHSPIYMFFETKEKDTLVDLNRKNSISSTNWIFNIDKRLPLKLVIPEVIKMQEKKSGSMHNNTESQNYFSYSDSIHKKLAFVPFTKVIYKLEKPKTGVTIYFSRNRILVDSIEFTKEKLEEYIENLTIEDLYKCNFCFDKNDSYGNFVKNYVFATTLEVKRTQTDTYIY